MFRNRQTLSFLILLILISLAVISPVHANSDSNYAFASKDTNSNEVTVIAIGDKDNNSQIKYGTIQATSFGTENIVITIISDEPFSTGNISPVYELLNPGETRFFSDIISKDQTKQYVRVTYDKPAPVSLQILTPDGEYGTYSDIDDGIEDNAIFMRIYSETGLDPGRWYYQVHLPDDASPASFQIESWDE